MNSPMIMYTILDEPFTLLKRKVENSKHAAACPLTDKSPIHACQCSN